MDSAGVREGAGLSPAVVRAVTVEAVNDPTGRTVAVSTAGISGGSATPEPVNVHVPLPDAIGR